MKSLIASLFLLFAATVCFGAVPSYDKFYGIGGIRVTTNPPTGTIVIDGTGIGGTNTSLNAAQVTNIVNAVVNTNVSYTSNYFITYVTTIFAYTSNYFNTYITAYASNYFKTEITAYASNYFGTNITYTSNYFNTLITTLFNTIYEVGSNDTNYVNTASSNNVRVAAGANITVVTNGSAGVTIYTVSGAAGGSGGTNYPPVTRMGTNVAVGTGVRKSLTIQTNISFRIFFDGTPLNGENVIVGVSNTSAAVIYMTTTPGVFDSSVASNVTTFGIPALSVKWFEFVSSTNLNLGVARWELRSFLGKEVELGAAGGLVMHTNPQNSIITISNRSAGLQEASPLGSVQFNSNNVQVGATDFTYTNGFVDIGNGPVITAKPGTLRATNVWDVSNVKYWGADPTGVADSTAAFQAAASQPNVYVPAGTYKLTGAIGLSNLVTWSGEGENSKIIYSGSEYAFTNAPNGALRRRGIKVRDLQVSLTNNAKGAFLLKSLWDSRLERVSIHGNAGAGGTDAGIAIEDDQVNNSFVVLEDCVVQQCVSDGVSIRSEGLIDILGGNYEINHRHGIYGAPGFATTLNVVGAIIEANYSNEVYVVYGKVELRNNWIESTLSKPNWVPVRLGEGVATSVIYGTVIEGNAFVKPDAGLLLDISHIAGSGLSHNITVSGNTVVNVSNGLHWASIGAASYVVAEDRGVDVAATANGLIQMSDNVSFSTNQVRGSLWVKDKAGIGMSPNQTLDVNGGISAHGASTATTGAGVEIDFGAVAASTGRIFSYDRSGGDFTDFVIGNSGGSLGLMLKSDGSFGIHTNAPASTLDLVGTMRTHGLGSNASPISLLGRMATGEIVETATVSGGSSVAPPISSVQFNSNNTMQGSAKLVFTNGNLGVGGGRLPTANVSVYRGLAGTAMDLTGSADQTVNDLRVDFNLTNNVDAVGTYARLGVQAGSSAQGEEYGDFYISTVTSGNLKERFRVTQDGTMVQTNDGFSVKMQNGNITASGTSSYIASNAAPSRKVAPANLHNIAIGSGWTNDMGARADLVIVLSQSDAATGDPGIMVTNVTDVSGITKMLTGGLVQTHQEPIYLLDVNPNDTGSIIDLSTGTGSAQSIKFAYWKLK